jgi:hypothetical protein
LRIKIDKLAVCVEDLANFGIIFKIFSIFLNFIKFIGYMKPEALRGLSDPELAKEAL